MSYAGIPLVDQQRLLPPCSIYDRPAAVRDYDRPQLMRCAQCEQKRLEAARKEVRP
jgi:hypothetical protein